MTHLYQALEVYCRTKQPGDRQLLKTALLQEIDLLKTARAYICKGITRAHQDRWESVVPLRNDFDALSDMIIKLFVDNGMSEILGQSKFDIREYTTDGDFFLNAARRVRKFVNKASPTLPPKIDNQGRANHGEAAPTANTSPQPRLVVNVERPGDLESRPDQTPIEEPWIIERMPAFETELLDHLDSVKGGPHEACNTANLLIACACADFMGVCRFMSRKTWDQIVKNATWFFVRKARQAKKTDENKRMRKVIDLVCQHPKPDDYEQQLLEALRITAQSKCDRVNLVQPVLQEHCRNLCRKHDLEPGVQ